jgi:hypothetical protein
MDHAPIFTALTQRNALRKAAKLPLLDLRIEMAVAIQRDAQRVYVEQCEKYDDDRRRIREDVLRELRVTRGADFPMSMGGRWLVGLMSDQRFRAFLEIEHGIRKPAVTSRHPISYGEFRRS